MARPLSPHLSIYRWQITMVLSILHRFTGVALVAGSILLALWLWTVAYHPGWYPKLHGMLKSPIGHVCMIGWTFAFYYHLGNGIRHLLWDCGVGFEIPDLNHSGWAVVFFTLIMTGLTWGAIFGWLPMPTPKGWV